MEANQDQTTVEVAVPTATSSHPGILKPQVLPAAQPLNQAEKTFIDARPCVPVLLPICGQTVFMAEYLTAGEDEDSYAALMSGTEGMKKDDNVPYDNTLAFKHKRIEFGVKKIVSGDAEMQFTVEWYRSLAQPDSKKIMQFIEKNYSDNEEKKSVEKK